MRLFNYFNSTIFQRFNSLIYIRGSIPGSKNSTVLLRESVKDVRRKTLTEKIESKAKKLQAEKGKKK